MQHMERDMLSRVKGERIPDFGESRIKTPLFKAKIQHISAEIILD